MQQAGRAKSSDGAMHLGGTQAQIVPDNRDRRTCVTIGTELQCYHDVLGLQVHRYILYSRFANSKY
jgi:hypothetical protein